MTDRVRHASWACLPPHRARVTAFGSFAEFDVNAYSRQRWLESSEFIAETFARLWDAVGLYTTAPAMFA